MGLFSAEENGRYTAVLAEDGTAVSGNAAWATRYQPDGDWKNFKLPNTVGAFVEGGANFLNALGIPLRLAIAVIATLVACFAATTLDTATRLQRYVVQELASSFNAGPLQNKYVATGLATGLGLLVALLPGPTGVPGTGGLILWPLFGAINQLLAGLAFMVLVFYLWRRSQPILFALLPMLLMLIMPAWALLLQMFSPENGWWFTEQYLLLGFGFIVMALQIWMIAEAIMIWPKARGVLEEGLPPLPAATS